MRKIFINKLVKEASKNKNILLIVGDLGFGIVDPFKDSFPNKFFNAGVAEQNMAGMAAGLSMKGFHVFIYSIANFSTLRCAEQIRNDIDYHNLPVTIVSVGSGLGYGNLGYSHHAIQDYALIRSFPNTLIVSPSNNQELEASLDYLFKNPQPSYLRLDKSLELDVEKKINFVHPGKWVFYKKSKKGKKKKNLILSTGSVYKECSKLLKNNYDWATIPMWGMKFKDQQLKNLKKYNEVVTVENHLQDGGFGSWLSECLTKKKNNVDIKILSKFLNQKVIGKVGTEEFLTKKYKIT